MKSVVICGSKRYINEINQFSDVLKSAGVVVFEPFFNENHTEWDGLSDEYKKYVALGLTHDHFYKIRQADVVFIYNKNAYAGNSTTLEIGYAVAMNKIIYSLETDSSEICRSVLFRESINTPELLIEKLK